MSEARDGFEVIEHATDEVVRFIACSMDGRQRERVEMGLLRNMNVERFGVRDTRDSEEAP